MLQKFVAAGYQWIIIKRNNKAFCNILVWLNAQ